MIPEYLFVYGTLRSDRANQRQRVLLRHTELLGKASVQGYLFALGPYTALVPASTAGRVTGELLRIASEYLDETLRELDAYEGLSDGSESHDYRRAIVKVEWKEEIVEAWSYILNRSSEGLERIRNAQ